jgi:CheY-like chemotaxis protein
MASPGLVYPAASLRGRAGRANLSGRVRLRCLIIDDNREFLRVVSMLLEGEGIDVVGIATSGAEGMTRASELEPDVVLVDIKLGGECGFVLASELVATVDSTVILISTYADADFADLFSSSPAAGFISKPSLSGDAIRDLVASGSPRT